MGSPSRVHLVGETRSGVCVALRGRSRHVGPGHGFPDRGSGLGASGERPSGQAAGSWPRRAVRQWAWDPTRLSSRRCCPPGPSLTKGVPRRGKGPGLPPPPSLRGQEGEPNPLGKGPGRPWASDWARAWARHRSPAATASPASSASTHSCARHTRTHYRSFEGTGRRGGGHGGGGEGGSVAEAVPWAGGPVAHRAPIRSHAAVREAARRRPPDAPTPDRRSGGEGVAWRTLRRVRARCWTRLTSCRTWCTRRIRCRSRASSRATRATTSGVKGGGRPDRGRGRKLGSGLGRPWGHGVPLPNPTGEGPGMGVR